MQDTVINVENLSKRFIISHEGRERYTSLRDVITRKAKTLFPSANKEITHRSKEEFWALQDITFSVKRGDRIGIIGRNGAGKSTLLKILSRITEPTAGSITIHGRVASLLEVGTGFHPELTGRENIFLNGAILGMTRAEIRKKFDEIVAFAEVEKFLDTPVKRFSSGMYVRLAFAVAAHLEPEILIVDEVLAVGDAQFQKKCMAKMEDVSKGGDRTVLFVSHNLGSVQMLCNRTVLLQKGQVEAVGATQEVIKKYLSDTANLTSTYRAGGDRKNAFLYFNRIYLTDASGKLKSIFSHDEDIFFHFDIGNNIPFEKLFYSLFLMIQDEVKQKVGAIESSTISGSKMILRVNRNYLTRGQYTIQAFIHKPRQLQLDAVDDVCSFEVIDNGSVLCIHDAYPYGNTFVSGEWINS